MRTALVALAIAIAPSAHAAGVLFVGCPSDGQQGPQAAPRFGPTPVIPAAAAAKLAWYTSADGIGVLAPRGWHCFGAMGSNGESLTVAPRLLNWKKITAQGAITGPAVTLALSSGGTSGRLEVARIAARLFPAARDFVDRVAAEGMDEPLVRKPYAADRITHRGAYEALFTTPSGARGLGTDWSLPPAPLPVDGIAILHPEADMDLTVLRARLPAGDRSIVAAIIAEVAARK